MTAADKILQKALVGSKIDSEGWSKVQAGLRDRAFFSSQVEEQKILYTMRSNVADLLKQEKSPSEIRRDIRRYLESIGYNPDANLNPGEKSRVGTIKDLRTQMRLDVMLKTNEDQAKGYVSHLRATTSGAILAFPAYELVRVQRRRAQRDWDARWTDAAKKVGWEGVSRNGEKIALKTSPIWSAISRFGNPFPPFDFNSGMGVRDVKKSKCREIGLIAEDEQPTIPNTPDFNARLKTQVPFDKGSAEFGRLRESFGDQIKYDDATRSVQWRSDLFTEAFEPKGKFEIKLGRLPKTGLLPELENAIGNNPLTLTKDNWLDVKRSDGTDHRTHFFNEPNHPENIPLKPGDVDMLPSIWRSPEQTRKIQKDIYEFRVAAVDGGDFVLQVINRSGHPYPWSFFRTSKKITSGVRMAPRKATPSLN